MYALDRNLKSGSMSRQSRSDVRLFLHDQHSKPHNREESLDRKGRTSFTICLQIYTLTSSELTSLGKL